MENDLYIDFEFRTNSVKKWFNDNYFIAMYDNLDNYLYSFDTIEEISHFFNKPFKYIVQAIKNNWCIEYNHQRCKLFVYEKEKDFEIESRGKRR